MRFEPKTSEPTRKVYFLISFLISDDYANALNFNCLKLMHERPVTFAAIC